MFSFRRGKRFGFVALLIGITLFCSSSFAADITIGELTSYHPVGIPITNLTINLTAFDMSWELYATFDDLDATTCDIPGDCIYFKKPLTFVSKGSYNSLSTSWWVIKDGSTTLYSGRVESFYVDSLDYQENFTVVPSWVSGTGAVILKSDVLGTLELYFTQVNGTLNLLTPIWIQYKVSLKGELRTELSSGLIPPKMILKGDQEVFHPAGVPYELGGDDPGAGVLEIKPRAAYVSQFDWDRYPGTDFDPSNPQPGNYNLLYTLLEGGADFHGFPAVPNTVQRTVHVVVAPTVSEVIPENGAVVAVNSNITATFSTAMDPSSITTDTFFVQTGLGERIQGTVSYNSDTLTATFNPDSDLTYETAYTATITTGVTSSGEQLPMDYIWSFSTPEQTAVTNIRLIGETLDDMAISAVFSSEIDPSTVTNESFFVESEDGLQRIEGTVNSNDPFTVSFVPVPGSLFNPDTSYRAVLTGAIIDRIGNPIQPETWVFTVENMIDTDGDGFTPSQGDCDDTLANIHPEAAEIPYDGIDQDCSGSDLTDVDGDGFDGGLEGDDCNDEDATINPNALEILWDRKDNNCDGQVCFISTVSRRWVP